MRLELMASLLGAKLRRRRANRGLRAIAEIIGISAATLSRMERGKVPTIESFTKTCAWLGVDPGAVLERGQFCAPQSKLWEPVVMTERTADELATMMMAAQRSMAYAEEGVI